MSTSNTTNPSNQSESQDSKVTNYSPEPLDTFVKPLKPVGRKRQETDTSNDGFWEQQKQLQAVQEDADRERIMDDNEIRAVVAMAARNPVTNDMIEKAKLFTTVNREKIKKQCTDLVAFYNIGHEKPFYFITPAEARMAIDYIKRCREGYIQDLEDQDKRDAFVREFMKRIGTPGFLETDTNKINLTLDFNSSLAIQEGVDKIVDKVCGIEMGDVEGTLDSKWHREHPYSTVEAFAHTIQELQGYDLSEAKEKQVEKAHGKPDEQVLKGVYALTAHHLEEEEDGEGEQYE
jgi:hypothetical protein